MQWTQDAENAVKKAPFFVRKKVRARVESQVAAANKNVVTWADVKTAQQRYLQSMSAEIKGYQIDIQACMSCGKCIGVCPTETIGEQERGFRIQLGGKLGRYPQLARELPGIYSQDQVLDIIN